MKKYLSLLIAILFTLSLTEWFASAFWGNVLGVLQHT